MKNNESIPEPKNDLDKLKEIISSSRDQIEQEYARVADEEINNSWMLCFGSMMSVINMYLSFPSIKEGLSREALSKAIKRMDKIKQDFEKLNKKYPDYESIIPEESKEKLVKSLDIFSEENN
ncbi:MAG: hypothetical protein WCF92_01915 [bacterium]